MTAWHPRTLDEVLADLRMAHESRAHGQRAVLRDGAELFRGTAGETWAWLRSVEHIWDRCAECQRDGIELDVARVCEDCHTDLARAAARQRRQDEWEGHCDYVRDCQKHGDPW